MERSQDAPGPARFERLGIVREQTFVESGVDLRLVEKSALWGSSSGSCAPYTVMNPFLFLRRERRGLCYGEDSQ